jgi:CRISPR-associated protein (TIGR02584 family)
MAHVAPKTSAHTGSEGTETVLLAVTGMSPAVLTETVWALAHEKPPLVPSRVIVLTTRTGKEQIERELFSPQPAFGETCVWDLLREHLEGHGHNLKGKLCFDSASSDDLRVLTRWDEGTHRKPPLDDIRTSEENEAAANTILEVVRSIVENPDTHLVASIAGGRKTLGTLLYACMTLIGRETDRLTHVLVHEPFDDPRLSPRFYFPGQPAAALKMPDGKTIVHAAEARIDLADIPFVPLRNLFARELSRMPGNFSALVARCRKGIHELAADEITLAVHRSRAEVEINGARVKLAPKEHLLMLFLTERARNAEPAFGTYKEAIDSLNGYRRKLRTEALADDFSDWRNKDGLSGEVDEEAVRKAISGVRAKLRKSGSAAMALLPFLPGPGRFSINLPSQQIAIAP